MNEVCKALLTVAVWIGEAVRELEQKGMGSNASEELRTMRACNDQM